MSWKASFIAPELTLEDNWRAIILFGRNVASYKFALAKSLLNFSDRQSDFVSLEDLAVPFSRHLCEHISGQDKQSTSCSSRYLDICRQFNRKEIRQDQLIDATVKLGFEHVIDAFHVVHDGDVPRRFFLDERSSPSKGIRLTEDLCKLADHFQFQNLEAEAEARWRLVETAWALRMPRQCLTVQYDTGNELLVANGRLGKRVSITACRDALSGYQKGNCFYCYSGIAIGGVGNERAEVDHFLPHALKKDGFGTSVDEVWNLVLACKGCNAGALGKFAKVPDLKYLERLHTRNEFFISSHHPLRETIIMQTGNSTTNRASYLQSKYNQATKKLIATWAPNYEHKPTF
jgi:hypothetical protein